MIAYNLENLWRRLMLPQRIKRWSLTSLQQRLVKTGGRLTASETCALLLAALSRGAPHTAAFWQHAEDDRGAASAGWLANQERRRIERSKVIQWREVLAAKLVGGEKQTRQARGTAKTSLDAIQRGPLELWLDTRSPPA